MVCKTGSIVTKVNPEATVGTGGDSAAPVRLAKNTIGSANDVRVAPNKTRENTATAKSLFISCVSLKDCTLTAWEDYYVLREVKEAAINVPVRLVKSPMQN
jgi:hypothetical protein